MPTPTLDGSKPPLVVLLAGGASVAVGGPSTPSLTDAVWKALREATEPEQPALWGRNLPGEISRVELLEGALNETFSKPCNFEQILHGLESMSSLESAWRIRREPHWSDKVIRPIMHVEGLLTGGPRGGLERCFNRYWLYAMTNALFGTIHQDIQAFNGSLPTHRDWPTVKEFVSQLNHEFDAYFITINYDSLIEKALDWDDAAQGFVAIPDEGVSRFDGHRDPLRLMHLHGSVAFGYRPISANADGKAETDPNRFRYEDLFKDLYWHPSPDNAIKTWIGMSPDYNQAGRLLSAGPVITGLQKTEKLLVEPYLSYMRHSAGLLARTPRLLVIGYGFGDYHINALLTRMTKWHGKARRIVVVDHRDEATWEPPEFWSRPEEDNFLEILSRWAEEVSFLRLQTRPSLWQPEGAGREKLRVSFIGLAQGIRKHGSEIGAFLKS
ncbi:MAG: SIR2 family protein [Planctomycetota bacterium]|nr:SIR2 family protein [Planctomycetota bacterium]